MILDIKNVGIIERASIEFNGLTVITGFNDTGKSTVGKLMFSLVKAFQKYDEEFIVDELDINELVTKIYLLLRRSGEKLEHPIIKEFYPKFFIRDILRDSNSKEIKSKINLIKSMESISKHTKKEIITYLDDIYDLLSKERSTEDKIKSVLCEILNNEFEHDLNQKSSKKDSLIRLMDGKNKIASIDITNDKLKRLKIYDEYIPFTDSTLIETPLIFNYFDNFSFTNPDMRLGLNSSKRMKSYYHINDLLVKLRNTKYSSSKNDSFLKNIHSLTSMKIKLKKVNPLRREFVFIKSLNKESLEIKNINTAVGIKSFALLDLLYSANYINENDILIIDEPEVHLHPQWQVSYVKLLFDLLKKNVNILITTHSPFIIEAIYKLGQQNQLINKINYYMTELNNSGTVIFKDKTNSVSDIMMKMTEPFEKLVFDEK